MSEFNILITGGAGFIGSHVTTLLSNKYPNYKIIVLDKLDYCSDINNLSSSKCKFIKGDILSVDLINYILKEEDINYIMHFAAQTHVDNSFGNSLKFTENNVTGTHILLECAKNKGIKLFIHVSTDEVYGESIQGSTPMTENESILEPSNPYAATKAAAEFLVKSYHKSFGLPIIITRGNNVYGPHQYPEKIIPKFITQLLKNQKVTIQGNGSNTRSYIYVEDVARAFDVILHKGKVGELYNISSDIEKSNIEIAKILIKKIKNTEGSDGGGSDGGGSDGGGSDGGEAGGGNSRTEEYISYIQDRPFNDCRYFISGDKLKKLGWKTTVDFDTGIEKTIEWYREKLNK